jgi:hypothetical protein
MGPIYWASKFALLELCIVFFFAQSLDCFLFLPTQEAAEKKEAGSNSMETKELTVKTKTTLGPN